MSALGRWVRAAAIAAVLAGAVAGCSVIFGSPSDDDVESVVTAIEGTPGWSVRWSQVRATTVYETEFYMAVGVLYDDVIDGPALLDLYAAIATVLPEDYRYAVELTFAEEGDPENLVGVREQFEEAGFDASQIYGMDEPWFTVSMREVYVVLEKAGRR